MSTAAQAAPAAAARSDARAAVHGRHRHRRHADRRPVLRRHDGHAGQGRHDPARLHGLLLRVPEGGRASSSGFDDLTALLGQVAVIRWSATIATNIIAERKGPRIGLLVSEGTGDELYGDGDERRRRPADRAREHRPAADGRDRRRDADRHPRRCSSRACAGSRSAWAAASRTTRAEQAVRALVDENFPDHYLGAVPLVLGSEICRHPDDQTRTHMALVNAYVHTPLAVALFKAEDQLLGEHNYRRPVYIAHVNGGVARVARPRRSTPPSPARTSASTPAPGGRAATATTRCSRSTSAARRPSSA